MAPRPSRPAMVVALFLMIELSMSLWSAIRAPTGHPLCGSAWSLPLSFCRRTRSTAMPRLSPRPQRGCTTVQAGDCRLPWFLIGSSLPTSIYTRETPRRDNLPCPNFFSRGLPRQLVVSRTREASLSPCSSSPWRDGPAVTAVGSPCTRERARGEGWLQSCRFRLPPSSRSVLLVCPCPVGVRKRTGGEVPARMGRGNL